MSFQIKNSDTINFNEYVLIKTKTYENAGAKCTVAFYKGHIPTEELKKINSLRHTFLNYITAIMNLPKNTKGFYKLFIDNLSRETPISSSYAFSPGLLKVSFSTHEYVVKTIFKDIRNGENFGLMFHDLFKHVFSHASTNPHNRERGVQNVFTAKGETQKRLRALFKNEILSKETVTEKFGPLLKEIAHVCIADLIESGFPVRIIEFTRTIASGGILKAITNHTDTAYNYSKIHMKLDELSRKLIMFICGVANIPFKEIDQVQKQLETSFNEGKGYLYQIYQNRLKNINKEILQLSQNEKDGIIEEFIISTMKKECSKKLKDKYKEIITEEALKRNLTYYQVKELEETLTKDQEKEISTLIENYFSLNANEINESVAKRKLALPDTEVQLALKRATEDIILHEIYENLEVLGSAGSEPIGATLVRILYTLAIKPEQITNLKERIDSELAECPDFFTLIGRLTKDLDPIIDSAIRTQPPAYASARASTYDQTMVVTEEDVNGKSKTFMHYFMEKETFFNTPFLAEIGEETSLDEFFAFGYGPQRCPGDLFAKHSLRTYLIYLACSGLSIPGLDPNEKPELEPNGPVLKFKNNYMLHFSPDVKLLSCIRNLEYKTDSKKEV